MPYIEKYQNKVLVIKYGGNAMISEELKKSVMRDLTLLRFVGINVVLVHGGGPEISETLKRMGVESRFVNGLRYTDEETAEVVRMVLAGKVNKELVHRLQMLGAKSVGMCGIDGGMLLCEKESDELGYVGKIVSVNTGVITDSLANGYLPVISTVGYDNEGHIYNVNADTAASAIAGALGAESLILMTDIRGLLRDKEDEDSLIRKVYVSDIPSLINEGVISGGMIPKINCCKEAIRRGVDRVFITDGRVKHSILLELLSDEGMGTMFVKGD
ncbi:MAG TPA: acetylglutamate kinase [Candidatus Gallimonas intestinavium]|uniref:Acetylglutamate kinase n=1 Tax=Candidatus Gallimonas intestinavium TaxID=2838603 RepID=A0A9D2K170_9FIRM|nr:acetylglutamate kinase [Candidatus Gallimonas intestinavium]